MNVHTLNEHQVNLRKVAKLLKTVGHHKRLLIIDLLLENGKLPVKEIFKAVEISQSNASQHLKALEDIGILISEREGKNICYSIQNRQIRNLLKCVTECTTC